MQTGKHENMQGKHARKTCKENCKVQYFFDLPLSTSAMWLGLESNLIFHIWFKCTKETDNKIEYKIDPVDMLSDTNFMFHSIKCKHFRRFSNFSVKSVRTIGSLCKGYANVRIANWWQQYNAQHMPITLYTEIRTYLCYTIYTLKI